MAAERITPEQVRGLHELLDSLGPHPGAAALAANDRVRVPGISARLSRAAPRLAIVSGRGG